MSATSEPSRRRTSSRRTRTRQALVHAAETLFRLQGYEATTIDQIALGAGVSRRTFFRHFPTKDAVVFPDAAERLARFEDNLAAAVEGEPGLSALRRAARAVGEELVADRKGQLLQQQLIAESPALVARERELDRRWEAALARRLGADDPDDEAVARWARLAAGAVMGAFRAAIREWVTSAGRTDLVRLGEQAMALVEAGLAAAHHPPGGTP
ncbi:MAG: hypothetical protein CSA66_03170 [Proteobacteria bacterium]|nr:MAG: hypothetical protein CSA66_03170 [Pseudomonadota bacterium]